MKSSDFKNSSLSCNEQQTENYDDLDFLLKGSSGIAARENQANAPSQEVSHAILVMNEVLKNVNLPQARNLLDDWITPQEVMQKMCISERTLAEWRRTNKIGFSRIENKFYYRKQDIENLLQSGYEKSKKAARKPLKI